MLGLLRHAARRRRVDHMEDDTSGGTDPIKKTGLWLFTLVLYFVGYAAPPLLGLGAAALIAAGNPWAVLVASIFLSVLAVACRERSRLPRSGADRPRA